jgi:hypothetical protein
VSEKDVKDASAGVLQDLKRFQKDKEGDLRRYMVWQGTHFPPVPIVANQIDCIGRICALPLGLGAEESRDVDGGKR